MSKTKILLIDGNSLVHRAFHALPPLTTKSGVLVNALYGFITSYLRALKDLQPTHVAVAFDRPEPTFRDEKYEPYKATRLKQPQELYDQFPLIREFLAAMHVASLDSKGFEADDVIGTLAHHFGKDHEVLILSGDLDPLQLVNKNVKVITPKKGLSETVIYDPAAVHQRYGINPDQLIDFKALKGDTSDNVPGVHGIGEKTAATLIKKFGALEKLYETLKKEKIEMSPSVVTKLQAGKDMAYLSRELVTIRLDVPLTIDLDRLAISEPNLEKIHTLFAEWQFMSLVPRVMGTETTSRVKKSSPKPIATVSLKDVTSLLQTDVAVGAVLEGEHPFNIQTRALGLARENTVAGLDPNHPAWNQTMDFLRHKPIIVHEAKLLAHAIANGGGSLPTPAFDTAIASYLINPGSRAHDLEQLAFTELHVQLEPTSGQKTLLDVRPPAEIAAARAEVTSRLAERFRRILKEREQEKLLHEIELPLVPVLVAMERRGVQLDTNFVAALDKRVTHDLEKLEKRIWKAAGGEFNIASPLQLKEVLFEKLKLPTKGLAKTKTGISTAADELEKLVGLHPIISDLMTWRELTKLKNTYLDTLPTLVNEKTGRVHTTYNQIVAATGRLSSGNPNLQNIPIRTSLGNEIRKAFVASPGHMIVSADYSQIELRIAAHIANDKEMLAAFQRGEDIHAHTAAEVYGVSLNKVTDEQRRHAKSLNFGVLYGMGVTSFAASTGLSREEAQAFIDQYFNVHKGIREYVETTKILAHKQGYVETLFGRRRYLPEIKAEHPMLRSAAERMAINHPVQGTDADINKLAMIKIHEKYPDLAMIMQVHDALVFEVPKADIPKVAQEVQNIMESVIKLKAPLKVDISSGPNWGSLKEL